MNKKELRSKLDGLEDYVADSLEKKLEDKVINEESNNLTGGDGEIILSTPELNKRLSHFRFSTDEFIDMINKTTSYQIQFAGNGLVKVIKNA